MNDYAPAHEPAPKWMKYMLGILFLVMFIVFAFLDGGKPGKTGEEYARDREIEQQRNKDAKEIEAKLKEIQKRNGMQESKELDERNRMFAEREAAKGKR